MKHKDKNQIKIWILLLGVLSIFTQCRKDDDAFYSEIGADQPLPNVTYYSNKTLPQEVGNSLALSLKQLNQKTKQTKGKDLQTSFGTILTDKIMLSVSDEGIENYTFSVELEDDDPKTFYNLILRKNLDGSFSLPYLKRYTMSDSFHSAYSSGNLSIDYFEGYYENFRIDEFIDIDILLGKSSRGSGSPCLVPVSPDDPDEPDDGDTGDGDLGDPIDGDGDTGGSGGGGGGSGTGPGGPSTGGSNSGGTTVTCTQRLVASPCAGNGMHYGGSECAGNTAGFFTGSIQLITTCSDGSVDVQDIRSSSSRGSGDCPNDDGDVGMMEDDAPPCKTFKRLANDDNFKAKLQDLKDKANTDDHETGYKLDFTVNGYEYSDLIEGESGQLGIDPEVGDDDQIDGFIHNHIDDSENRDLSIFSPHDLYTLYKWLKNDNIRDRGSFVFVVTTAQGTTYALRIKSKSKFIAFGDINLEGLQFDPTQNNSLPNEYGASDGSLLENNGGIKNGNTNNLNEKNFLNLLDFADAGLQTFKSDSNFENWEELEYDRDTNSITPKSCN